MHLMCFDFLFGVVNSLVEHGENAIFEDPGTDGCSQGWRLCICAMFLGYRCERFCVQFEFKRS